MNKKQGISLIVLVITIIVMIILASVVVISISDTGIINRANQAVDESNEKQVQDLAALVWADSFMTGKRGAELEEDVLDKLKDYVDKYEIIVTDTGASVVNKDSLLNTTLGHLITSAKDYGKTINYEANGVTDWKVFYHTENYVYLIATEALAMDQLPIQKMAAEHKIPLVTKLVTKPNGTTKVIGHINLQSSATHRDVIAATIQRPELWMANFGDYSKNYGKLISCYLDETIWDLYKNTTSRYSEYIEGAIGTPTVEMFVASWNAKREATGDFETYNKKLALVSDGSKGYYVNDITSGEPATSNTSYQYITPTDTLYTWDYSSHNSDIYLAGMSTFDNGSQMILQMGYGIRYFGNNGATGGLRPVICLRADVPAGTGIKTDFII